MSQEPQLQHFLAGNIQVKRGFASDGHDLVPRLQRALCKSTSDPPRPQNPSLGLPLFAFMATYPTTGRLSLILLVGPSFSHHISANDLTGVLLSAESH